MLRILKIIIGLGLLAVSLWALLLPPYFPSSAYSVVNARKVVVATEEAGQIANIELPTAHSPVQHGQIIAKLQRDQNNRRHEIEKQDLQSQRLAHQIAQIEAQLTQRQSALAEATQQHKSTQAASVLALQEQQKAAQARLKIQSKRLETMLQDTARMKTLLDEGIVTQAQWAEHEKLSIEAESQLHTAESELARIKQELENTRISKSAPTNETSNGLNTTIASLQHEIRSLKDQRESLTAELNELRLEMETSRAFIQADASDNITSPVDGVIWRSQVVPGQQVAAGQVIAHIADQNTVFVEAFFARHYLDMLSPGDYAHILLTNEKRYIEGHITEIQVQETVQSDLNIINAVSPDKSMLRVLIEVPADALGTQHIGKLTKVVVTSSEPGWMQKSLVWLSFMLRSEE